MRDPTREDMLAVLLPQFPGVEADEGDYEIAMYWFAMYWHGGQSSNLYSVLSTSPYNPGPIGRLEGENCLVHHMYDALEAEYGESDDISVRRGPEDHEQGSEVDPIRHGALT